jgi:hypothetical protein
LKNELKQQHKSLYKKFINDLSLILPISVPFSDFTDNLSEKWVGVGQGVAQTQPPPGGEYAPGANYTCYSCFHIEESSHLFFIVNFKYFFLKFLEENESTVIVAKLFH